MYCQPHPKVKLSESGTLAIFVHINANYLMNFNLCPFCVHLRLSEKMSTRTIADIEADIVTLKNANPNWPTNVGVLALMTSLTTQINVLSAPAPVQPGNYPVPVNFIELFPSLIFHICILFAFDEFHWMR